MDEIPSLRETETGVPRRWHVVNALLGLLVMIVGVLLAAGIVYILGPPRVLITIMFSLLVILIFLCPFYDVSIRAAKRTSPSEKSFALVRRRWHTVNALLGALILAAVVAFAAGARTAISRGTRALSDNPAPPPVASAPVIDPSAQPFLTTTPTAHLPVHSTGSPPENSSAAPSLVDAEGDRTTRGAPPVSQPFSSKTPAPSLLWPIVGGLIVIVAMLPGIAMLWFPFYIVSLRAERKVIREKACATRSVDCFGRNTTI